MPRKRKYASDKERFTHHTKTRSAIQRAVKQLHETISEAAETGNEMAQQLLGTTEVETLNKICSIFPNCPERFRTDAPADDAAHGPDARPKQSPARSPTYHR